MHSGIICVFLLLSSTIIYIYRKIYDFDNLSNFVIVISRQLYIAVSPQSTGFIYG